MAQQETTIYVAEAANCGFFDKLLRAFFTLARLFTAVLQQKLLIQRRQIVAQGCLLDGGGIVAVLFAQPAQGTEQVAAMGQQRAIAHGLPPLWCVPFLKYSARSPCSLPLFSVAGSV